MAIFFFLEVGTECGDFSALIRADPKADAENDQVLFRRSGELFGNLSRLPRQNIHPMSRQVNTNPQKNMHLSSQSRKTRQTRHEAPHVVPDTRV